MTSTVVDDAVESQIVPCFDRTINVEPLRHRPDDIRAMIPAMLRTLSPNRDLQVSPRAVNQLARHPWPGNATQLRDVLRRVVAAKRTGTIELADLPPECMAVGRRTTHAPQSLKSEHHTNPNHRRTVATRARGPAHRYVAGDDLPQDPRLQHRHPALRRQEGSRIDTAWMSMPMSPPTSVPLMRMNWRSRPHLQLDPLGGLLAVPAVDVWLITWLSRAVAVDGIHRRIAARVSMRSRRERSASNRSARPVTSDTARVRAPGHPRPRGPR